MGVTSGKQFGVGLRHAQVFELDASGYPAATNATAYEGYEIVGPKAFDLTTPDPRKIFHTGNDRLLAQDFLPTLEGASGALRVSRNDYDVFATMTGTKKATIGAATVIGYATDKQGSEPDLGMLLFQQSKDGVTKLRRWRAYILPVANANIKPSSMNDNGAEYEYNILPLVATQHLWGVDFDDDVEGFTEAQLIETMTENQPWIAAFKATGAEKAYSLTHKAVSTAKIHVVTKAGVAQTTGYTMTTSAITFTDTPAANSMIVAFYEIAA